MVFLHDFLAPRLLQLVGGEPHVFAGVVVFENADADALERRQLAEFGNGNIIQIFHPDRLLGGPVVAFALHLHGNTRLLQF